jgi:cell wall-associated NlpC family hydrolase
MRRHLNKNRYVLNLIFILMAANLIFNGIAWSSGGVIFSPSSDSVYATGNKAVVSINTPVAINSNIKNAIIYYTTDGTIPTTASIRYTGPITITRDTTIKATALRDGIEIGPFSTINYIVYSSPYDISSITSEASLSMDFIERDALLETEPISRDWYKKRLFSVQNRYWGPKAKQYPGIKNPKSADPAWSRRRIIAVAARYINTQYQHHCLIKWDPPQTWPLNPLLPVRLGHQSPGTDCSNFTSWVYNFGLGVEFTGYIDKQARMSSVRMPDGSSSKVEILTGKLFRPDFNKLASKLKMGDLVYISSGKGEENAGHVVIWIGKDPKTGEWLVIDSYDMVSNSIDSAGNYIPSGVQIRAFRKNSWYYKGFITALRIIQD